MPQWQKVNIPAGGNFIGWGRRAGQYVEGRVLRYDEAGGVDFNGKTCPQLDIELTKPAASFNKKLERTNYDPGTTVTVTAGPYELRKGLMEAEPNRDDMIRMELDGEEELDGGNTMKHFSIQIARSEKGGRGSVRVVDALPADDPADDEIPF